MAVVSLFLSRIKSVRLSVYAHATHTYTRCIYIYFMECCTVHIDVHTNRYTSESRESQRWPRAMLHRRACIRCIKCTTRALPRSHHAALSTFLSFRRPRSPLLDSTRYTGPCHFYFRFALPRLIHNAVTTSIFVVRCGKIGSIHRTVAYGLSDRSSRRVLRLA